MARANAQWRTSSDSVDALALFAGSDAYVSPSLYPSKREHGRVVPTWNYTSVHVYGRLIVHDDPGWKLDLVRRLTEHHEAGRAQPWAVDDAPPDFIERQLGAIVGLEIAITRIEGKRKLSQNRSAADVEAVAEALSAGSTRDQGWPPRCAAALIDRAPEPSHGGRRINRLPDHRPPRPARALAPTTAIQANRWHTRCRQG